MLTSNTFDLPIADLVAANGALANYRIDHEDAELANLAQSMRELGQLQPVLVARTDSGWVLAAGFRRVAALISIGGPSVRAQEVPADQVDLVRLAENFDRQDPSSYETCRYLYELNRGRDGTRKRTHGEIAQAVGLSARHVGNLIRVYRDAPPELRDAWKQDRDRRFTFSALNEIVVKAKRGEDFSGVLEAALGARKAPKAPTAAAQPEAGASKVQGPKRRLGRTGAKKLVLELLGAGAERLKTDERAVILLEVLGAVSGEVPVAEVKSRVAGVLKDLGVTGPQTASGAQQLDIEKGWV